MDITSCWTSVCSCAISSSPWCCNSLLLPGGGLPPVPMSPLLTERGSRCPCVPANCAQRWQRYHNYQSTYLSNYGVTIVTNVPNPRYLRVCARCTWSIWNHNNSHLYSSNFVDFKMSCECAHTSVTRFLCMRINTHRHSQNKKLAYSLSTLLNTVRTEQCWLVRCLN